MTTPLVHNSAYMFDAMWTAAIALNRTATRLKERNLTLMNFSYDDEYNISDIIYEEALKVEFFGLTVSYIILIAFSLLLTSLLLLVKINVYYKCI